MIQYTEIDDEQVLREVIEVITDTCPRVDPEVDEIMPSTSLRADLGVTSVELITVAGRLKTRYAGRVDFAEFVTRLPFRDFSTLTVGCVVDYITPRLTGSIR